MSAMKNNLHAAAALLGMDPDDLLAKLDPPIERDPGDTWGWYTDAEDQRPAPEGMQVFAHWSRSHAGVNVEIDAPEGLPLTVHVNDWRAVETVVGE